jgi:hypothetical protein
VDFNIGPDDAPEIWVFGSERHVRASGTRVPLGEWFCYRGHVHLDHVDGVVKVWIGEGNDP